MTYQQYGLCTNMLGVHHTSRTYKYVYTFFPQYDIFAYIIPKKTTWICIVHTEMVWEDMKEGLYTKCYLKLAQIISELEGQRLQTRPFPNKTRPIWVLGKHRYKPAISRAGTPNPFGRTSASKGLFQKKTWWNMLPSIVTIVSRKSYVFFVHGRKLLPVSNCVTLIHRKTSNKHDEIVALSRDTVRLHDARPASLHQRWSCETNDGFNPIQDGAPEAYYFSGFIPSYTPFTTMVFHRVCWGSYNYLITRVPVPFL